MTVPIHSPGSPSELEAKRAKIRGKNIPWEGYQRANLLSQKDVVLIQEVADANASSQGLDTQKAEQVIKNRLSTFAALYSRLLSNLSRADTLQYVVVLIVDFISNGDSKERASLFFSLSQDTLVDAEQSESIYPALVKHLDSNDSYLTLQVPLLISTFLSYDPDPRLSQAIHGNPQSGGLDEIIFKLLSAISKTLRLNEESDQYVALESLSLISTMTRVRLAIWDFGKETQHAGLLQQLTDILKTLLPSSGSLPATANSTQVLYLLLFTLWELSFQSEIAEGLNSRTHIIPSVLAHLRVAPKEKVTRIILAFLVNLLSIAKTQNTAPLLASKTLEVVKQLSARTWSDDDIVADLEVLGNELRQGLEGMTTYDQYYAELESGDLTWGPIHKNEDFWRENALKLNSKDRDGLKLLIKTLDSQDPTVLSIATSDIGMYLKYVDTGRRYIEELGARNKIVALMGYEGPAGSSKEAVNDVRYNSLVTLQRTIGRF